MDKYRYRKHKIIITAGKDLPEKLIEFGKILKTVTLGESRALQRKTRQVIFFIHWGKKERKKKTKKTQPQNKTRIK